MLDRPEEKEVDQYVPPADVQRIPAISVQYTIAIGQTKQLTLTTGVELEASPGAINAVLDKIVNAGIRQDQRHDLEMTRKLLANAEQTVHNHRIHRQDAENKLRLNWELSSKKGPFRLSDNQESQLKGLDGNVDNAIAEVRRLQTRIEELEKLCL